MRFSHEGASLRALTPTLTRPATLVLSALMAFGALLTVAPTTASAATTSGSTSSSASSTSSTSSSTQTQHMSAAQRFQAKADRVLRVASRQKGDPYRYGAAGPHAFDCSGLVMYVFKHALGKNLPHNAEAQLRDSKRIERRHLLPGDLIFAVDSSGYAYHVGIYAGHHRWWVAPHSGTRVQKQYIYHARFRYGRIIHWH